MTEELERRIHKLEVEMNELRADAGLARLLAKGANDEVSHVWKEVRARGMALEVGQRRIIELLTGQPG